MNAAREIQVFGIDLGFPEVWLFSAIFGVAILFSGYQLWSAIERGRVSFKGATYRRDKDGLSFKIYVLLYFLLFLIAVAGAIGWSMDYAARR